MKVWRKFKVRIREKLNKICTVIKGQMHVCFSTFLCSAEPLFFGAKNEEISLKRNHKQEAVVIKCTLK